MPHTLSLKDPFVLESGAVLPGIDIAYQTYGRLNADRDNVIWIGHALTANAEANIWWEGLFGPNQLFDSNKWFIVCANMLGSCYGTTGPGSLNPFTGQPYNLDFPLITVRDMAMVHDLLRKYLGIETIQLAIGGSMGGQQMLEWAYLRPSLIHQLALLATNAVHSPWGIAFNEAQRMAIQTGIISNDPEALTKGLEAARAIGMLSYRNYHTFSHTQKETEDKIDQFKAASYQNYQGQKLSKRFNPHSYIVLSKAMDSHNLGRGRGGLGKALSQIQAKTVVIGIRTDILFPLTEQNTIANLIPEASFHIIDSRYGHDGFLIEFEKITNLLLPFLETGQFPEKSRFSDEVLAIPGSEGF
jgi:homoserine O-acetyltransferase